MKKIIASVFLTIFVLTSTGATICWAAKNSLPKKVSWQKIEKAILTNKVSWAIKQLKKRIEKDPHNNRAQLYLARAYYQRRNYKKSLATFNLIPTSSPYWLTAQEESAWAALMTKQFNISIATLKTLLSNVFQKQIHPDTYFLASLNYLYVCDYPHVFSVSKTFKSVFTQKIDSLEALSQGKKTEEFKQILSSLSLGQTTNKHILKSLQLLPNNWLLDARIQSFLSELSEQAKRGNKKSISVITNRIKQRTKTLAKGELDDIREAFNKLSLIEGEVIQRIHTITSNERKTRNEFKPIDSSDSLTFPVDERETWVDELGNYNVSLKSCPTFDGGRYASKK